MQEKRKERRKGKNSADEEEQKSRTLDSVNELQVITTIFIQKKKN